jgi:hypothetical protein
MAMAKYRSCMLRSIDQVLLLEELAEMQDLQTLDAGVSLVPNEPAKHRDRQW